jgi:hypothetical protein
MLYVNYIQNTATGAACVINSHQMGNAAERAEHQRAHWEARAPHCRVSTIRLTVSQTKALIAVIGRNVSAFEVAAI